MTDPGYLRPPSAIPNQGLPVLWRDANDVLHYEPIPDGVEYTLVTHPQGQIRTGESTITDEGFSPHGRSH